MSISPRKKTGRGRPPIDSEEVRSRFNRDLLDGVDRWIETHPTPRPSRSEAVRQLVKAGLDASTPAAPLDEQLARAEKKLAHKIPAKASPWKGLALMRHGLAAVEHRALVEKKRAGTSRPKVASEPASDAPAKPARGKKGIGVHIGP